MLVHGTHRTAMGRVVASTAGLNPTTTKVLTPEAVEYTDPPTPQTRFRAVL